MGNEAKRLIELRERIARSDSPDLTGRAVLRDIAASIIDGACRPALAEVPKRAPHQSEPQAR